MTELDDRIQQRRIQERRVSANLAGPNKNQRATDIRGSMVPPTTPSKPPGRTTTTTGPGTPGGPGGPGGGAPPGAAVPGQPPTEAAAVKLVSLLEGITAWYRDPKTGKFYAQYTLPKSSRKLVFEATDADMDAVFGSGVRPQTLDIGFRELTGRTDTPFAGGIGEVEGTGAFQSHVDRVIALALDEGKLPAWAANSAAAEELLFISISEKMESPDWLINQLAKLPEFTTRFPGIDEFVAQGLTTVEAIQAHLEMETKLKSLETSYGMGTERVTPQTVEALVKGGYSIEDVAKAYSTFKRMKDFAPAFEAFNEVLLGAGASPRTSTSDMYAFLDGKASADVYELYEGSSLREAAVQAGIGDIFAADEALLAAAAIPFNVTPEQAHKGMQQAAQQILRIRSELDLGRYAEEISADDLVDISLGIAPRSGRSQAEVAQTMDKIVQNARGFLKESVAPFYGFTKSGKPQARSFGELRQ